MLSSGKDSRCSPDGRADLKLYFEPKVVVFGLEFIKPACANGWFGETT